MRTKVITAGLMTLLMSATALNAYDLKSNMLKLNTELSEIQQGIMTSNEAALADAVDRFVKDADELLSNKDKIAAMLPKGKKNKANIAVNTAHIIDVNIQIIKDSLTNKYNLPHVRRQEDAQRAYTYIEHACFNCHNLVRDQ